MRGKNLRILLAALLALEIALLILGPQANDHLPAVSEALANDARPNWWDDAAMGVRRAAWVNAALLVALMVTAKWWTRSLSSPPLPAPRSPLPAPKWFWPSLGAAALLCLGLRLPLASKSLWWDEAWVIMQASHGKWTPDRKHEGQLKFTAHDWKRCAWYYQKPTNHAPMSLLQKVSISAWQKLTGAKRSEFSDLAARVPALLASCVAVVLLGCLLRAWGRPGAGVCAAFILAIHPWHIRYGVDARAYALVVPLCISGMFAVTRIIECGGRLLRPWVWWGATEFLWMWAFPNALFDVAALNIVAALFLWPRRRDTPVPSVERHRSVPSPWGDRWTAMLRLLVMNVFAAMGFVQMFLPNLMQARRWAGQEADAHVLDWKLAGDTLGQLGAGEFDDSMVWLTPGSGVALLGVGLVLVAAVRRRRRPGSLLMLALFGSAGCFALAMSLLGSYYYARFSIAVLPVLVAGCCLLPRSARGVPLALGIGVLFLVAVATPLRNVLAHPIAPLHDVARFAENDAGPGRAAPLFACYGLGREVMPVYAPDCVALETREDLEAIMRRAKSEQRSLLVTYGYDGFNRSMLPTGFALLDDRKLFEEVKAFAGIEPEFYFRVLRMK